VPETTVNKNRKAVLTKDEIRSSDYRLMAPPASDPVETQQLGKGDLRVLVSTPADGHMHSAPIHVVMSFILASAGSQWL
jgi:hypothetical protein